MLANVAATKESASRYRLQKNIIAILGNDAPYKDFEKLELIVTQKFSEALIIQYSTRRGNYSNLHKRSLSDEILLRELTGCKYIFIGYREITQSQNFYWAAAAGTHAIVSKQVLESIDVDFEIVDKWLISVNNDYEEFWIISISLDRALAMHDSVYNQFWKQL